jgi:uncharacterized protein
MNDTAKLKAIDALLETVPRFTCKPGCADCCGPLMMSRLEAKRIRRATGIDPMALMNNLEQAIQTGCLTCPFVHPETHRCTIYEIRPAVCRIFGASEHRRLTCPHGCRPEKLMTNSETDALMDQIDKLGY